MLYNMCYVLNVLDIARIKIVGIIPINFTIIKYRRSEWYAVNVEGIRITFSNDINVGTNMREME